MCEGARLRMGARAHNAIYNPIPTSISRFFFIYDSTFFFLSSDYQAHVNYDDFTLYYRVLKESIYNIYREIYRKKNRHFRHALFLHLWMHPFGIKKKSLV